MEPLAEDTSDKMALSTKDNNPATFVKIIDEDDDDDIMEIPSEVDGTILLSTIHAQFPTAMGLKYNSSIDVWEFIAAEDNILHPPSDGWGETTYYITKFGQSNKYVGVNMCVGKLSKVARKRKLPKPTYKTVTADGGFLSTVTFNGKRYKGSDICKTSLHAEHRAAWVAFVECRGSVYDTLGHTFKGDLKAITDKNELPWATYETVAVNGGYISTARLSGNQYKGMHVCKNQKEAEQNAAQVALSALIGIPVRTAKKEQSDESVEPPLMCKDKLKELAKKMKHPLPAYKIFIVDDGFLSSVVFNGHLYAGKDTCKTHQHAEQMAAQTALMELIETSLQCDEQHRETVHKGSRTG